MKKIYAAVLFLLLAGCCCDPSYVPSYRRDNPTATERSYRYQPRQATYTYYRAPKGQVLHVAGFDIQQGQQMRDFFDDFVLFNEFEFRMSLGKAVAHIVDESLGSVHYLFHNYLTIILLSVWFRKAPRR